MANSKYAYVRSFELPDNIIPSTFMVVRLDGHAFHRFSADHGFEKPNDERALRLMDAAAKQVMKAYPEVAMAFGESDEYSFLLRKSCNLYNRRSSKMSSFRKHHSNIPPSFDGRVVAYPSSKEILDYFAWRQADTHINNLYNTTFWALVLQGKMSTAEAHNALKGTTSSQKQEILFSKFQNNYNALPERFRKGSVLYRQEEVTAVTEVTGTGETALSEGTRKKAGTPRSRKVVVVEHCDIIGRTFWEDHAGILGGDGTAD